ncbi:MAG TPA: T9SS type A sorting domain-containing protein, partial [Chryseolinea sp.]|nr:T9SS type A sorting domain-containing protein [Chryseolinea sp.]
IGAPGTQDAGDVHYYFQSWSNDGDTSQVIATPTDDISLTAHYGIVVGTEATDGETQFAVYPNPSSSGEVKIHIFSRYNQSAEIRMVDVLSREVGTARQELHTGSNELAFSYGKVKRGVYSILLNVSGTTASRRLIVSE